jgi:ribosomal protein S18 acetylase RimI-like enzyme
VQTLNIREAESSDLSQLLEFEQSVIAYERPYNASIKSNGVHYYDLPQMMSDEESHVLVAVKAGVIVAAGLAQIRLSKEHFVHQRHAYLGFMFVSPDHRGQGINRQVIDRLVSWSSEHGVKDVYLDVYAQNESAIKAYQKVGFAPCLLEMKLCV